MMLAKLILRDTNIYKKKKNVIRCS